MTASEAALAILAEAVAARYGREGGRLTSSPNQIHAVGMTSGLILAAGGGNALWLRLPEAAGDRSAGGPLLEWAVRAQCAVPGLERVVVVLGSRAAEVRAAVGVRTRRGDRVRGLGRRARRHRCGGA